MPTGQQIGAARQSDRVEVFSDDLNHFFGGQKGNKTENCGRTYTVSTVGQSQCRKWLC